MDLNILALVIGLAIILVGLLLLRFVLKTVITLLKVAVIVCIGIGVWVILQLTGLVGS